MLLIRDNQHFCCLYDDDETEVSIERGGEDAPHIKIKYGERVVVHQPQEPSPIVRLYTMLVSREKPSLYAVGKDLTLQYKKTPKGCDLTFATADGQIICANIEHGVPTISLDSNPVSFTLVPLDEITENIRWIKDNATLYNIDTDLLESHKTIILIVSAMCLSPL